MKRIMIACLVVFLVALIMSSLPKKKQTQGYTYYPPKKELYVLTPGMTTEQRKNALEAFNIFAANCPVLFVKYKADIDKITMSLRILEPIEFGSDYLYEDYGWASYYKVAVVISDNPTKIPARCRADGHTMHYNLGSGRSPGIVIAKGWTIDDDCNFITTSTLHSVQQMQAIKF